MDLRSRLVPRDTGASAIAVPPSALGRFLAARPLLVDSIFGLAYGVLMLAVRSDPPEPTRAYDVISVITILGVAGAFVLRRVRVAYALVLAAASLLLAAAVEEPDIGLSISAAFIIYAGACRHPRSPQPALIAAAVITAGHVVALAAHGHYADAFGAILVDGAVYGLAFLLGLTTRQRAEAIAGLQSRNDLLERDREREATLLVADERARIARELHDVVAHAVTVMVLQADGARGVAATDPARADAAFDTIQRAGRQALDDLRRALGVLREDVAVTGRAPLPHLCDLSALVASFGDTEVTVSTSGDVGSISAGVGLAGYRIVQEAITNARKHGHADRVQVTVEVDDDVVHIEVVDDGRLLPAPASSGHGLVGMRERAAMCGGVVHAGPRPDGGWLVDAELHDPQRVRQGAS